MWNVTYEGWLEEVKRSLKSEKDPVFAKKISSDQSINPFSKKLPDSQLQKNISSTESFLVIQNYSDFKKANMQEWMGEPDVALRFRELADLKELNQEPLVQNKQVFLSQPFPFMFDEGCLAQALPIFEKRGHLNLGWSPLSFGLTRGEILKRPYADWEKIFQQKEIHADNITWFYLSSAPYQWAGAEPHVELSVILSLAYSILKELTSVGLTVDQVREKITFGLSLGTDILTESAKIAALKILWDRMGELFGAEKKTAPVPVYVLPSLRTFSGRDPWNNIMRLSLMSFSAITGGAQGFKCIPYDVLNKQKSVDAIRVSTNIPLLLKREGFLNLVDNPYDGSSLFAETVDRLCRSAWSHFQEIERKGGVFESVRSGWLQSDIKRSGEVSKDALNYRDKELVGINKYVAKDPSYIKGAASDLVKLNEIIDPLFLKKSDDDYLSVEPLVVSSLGYDWEKMQCLSDKYFWSRGVRPSVTVVKGGGPIVEKKAAWLQTLLHLGGLEAQWLTPEEVTDIESHQSLVIIMPGNDEAEEQMAAALKAKGMEKVWSTGSGRQGLAIDRFIDVRANAMELVDSIHRLRVEIL